MVDCMGYCLFCGKPAEEHHVWHGTSNRAKSERYGLKVPLCHEHHRNGADSPHRNRIVDLALMCWAQKAFEDNCGSREDFRREFGKSVL